MTRKITMINLAHADCTLPMPLAFTVLGHIWGHILIFKNRKRTSSRLSPHNVTALPVALPVPGLVDYFAGDGAGGGPAERAGDALAGFPFEGGRYSTRPTPSPNSSTFTARHEPPLWTTTGLGAGFGARH